MKKLLVIVDMQNDFVTGSLANPEAEKIIPGIVELINKWDGDIIFTQDTHYDDYLDTQEGKKLPIKHCLDGKWGWQIVKELDPFHNYRYIKKETFGYSGLANEIGYAYDNIYFCGTCTDICVISNAIILKSAMPESRIIVLKDLCAGTTKENHENALKAMAQCQIDIE